MRAYCYIVIFYMAVCIRGLAADTNNYEWGPRAGDFQMSIRFKNGDAEVKTNQPVELVVRIRNLSTNETLSFMIMTGGEASSLETSWAVVSPSGKDIYVPHSRMLKDGSYSGSIRSITVPPQGASEYDFQMGCLGENATNGVYKIIAKRKVLHGVTVTSNTLQVKVVPGEWKAPYAEWGRMVNPAPKPESAH